MTISPTDKALDQKPCDLILETRVESAAQLSSQEPHTTVRQRPQPGAVLHYKDIEEKVETSHMEPMEAGGVPSGGADLEPLDFGHFVIFVIL